MKNSSTASRFVDLPVTKQGLSAEEMVEYLDQHGSDRELSHSYQTVVRLATEVQNYGGRAFLVGGAVRDEVLGVAPNDFDLEIHGLSAADVENKLAAFGVTRPTGKSFGTYKLPSSVSQAKIELSLPRRDSQMGDAHNDVDVAILPELGLTEAARRREFTIGAIYKDILTGEIFDPFKGIDDLREKKLRMVDPKTFSDDALRVLRGAAHAARFGLTVEPETKRAMSSMVEKMGLLPKMRLQEEWSKLLVTGQKPSLGLELLRDIGMLERWHPELAKLWSTQQDPKYHPEGSVGSHTMMVLDGAAELAQPESFSASARREFMFAALLHDQGKLTTTKEIDGVIHAYGHEAAGVKPAEEFLQAIGTPPVSIARISTLIANHMRPPDLYRQRDNISDRALRRLAFDVGPSLVWPLVILAEADHRGRGPFTSTDGQTSFPDTGKYHDWWLENKQRLELHQEPELILYGRDLVESERGWSAGPAVGQAVRLAKLLAIEGLTRPEVLSIIDESASPEEAVEELRRRVTPD